MQEAALVSLILALNVPFSHSKQVVLPVPVLYDPAGHPLHIEIPSLDANVPCVHARQLVCFSSWL